MAESPRDLTPLAPLGQARVRSGPVRAQRPVYVDLLPPCNNACPAGENIQGWLGHARVGQRRGRLAAARPPTTRSPRSTAASATTPARRPATAGELDESVSIHAVERYLGDLAIERGWQFWVPEIRSGRRVLVVGAGPSGLSAAYHLTRLGHEVVVRDNGPQPGGMMRYGIPAYRLPRDVLDAEVATHRRDGRRLRAGPPGHRSRRRAGGLRRGLRRGRRPPEQAGRHPQRRRRPGGRRRELPAGASSPASRPRCPARSRCTAAATPPWTPHGWPAGWVPTTRSSSTAGPASRCRRTTRRRPTPRRRESGSTGCARSARWTRPA